MTSRLTLTLLCAALCGASGCVETPDPEDGGPVDGALADAARVDAAPVDAAPCSVPDGDGDGRAAVACGGDDCDDTDPDRYPGNAEVCDVGAIDEDCDPTTVGGRDVDGDTFVDVACCNRDGATLRCGDDCNDAAAGVHVGATEACDTIDNDCDDAVDEMATVPVYVDADGDGHGVGAAFAGCAGTSGTAPLGGDCDDADGDRHPGRADVCNGVDDDCDGLVDDIIDGNVVCAAGGSRACRTSCALDGMQLCNDSCLGWDTCSAPEVCNACDDDNDGADDEDFECVRGASAACTVPVCGTAGTQLCDATCAYSTCIAAEACNYCDDDGDGNFNEERPLAVQTRSSNFQGCGSDVLFGTGTSCGTEPTVDGFDLWAELMDGTAVPQAGALWLDLGGVVQGWGPIEFTAEMEVTAVTGGGDYEVPIGGWALLLARGGTPGVGEAAAHGVPLGVPGGVGARWFWSTFDSCHFPSVPPSGGDSFRGAALGPSGLGSLVRVGPAGDSGCFSGEGIGGGSAGLDGPSSGTIVQRMVVRYTPDDPTTGGNEEELRVSASTPSHGGSEVAYSYIPTDALPIGSGPLRVAITAGTYTRTGFSGPPSDAVFGVPVRARVRVMDFTNPGCCGEPPVSVYPLSVSRAGLCP